MRTVGVIGGVELLVLLIMWVILAMLCQRVTRIERQIKTGVRIEVITNTTAHAVEIRIK